MNDNTFSIWSLYKAGGIIMHPIAFLLVVTLALAIERILYFATTSLPPKILTAIRSKILESDFEGALELVSTKEGPISNVLKRGLERMTQYEYQQSQRVGDFERYMKESIIREAAAIQRNAGWLGIIGQAGPLLGLLGTVMGMIRAFLVLGQSGGHASAASLAGGVGVALTTTFAGLLLGLIAFFFHEHFSLRARDLFLELERVAIEMTNAIVHARQPDIDMIQIETL